MAEKLGALDSGITNEHLEASVNAVVDELAADPSIRHYFPSLTAWSTALVIPGLARRYARGELNIGFFIELVAAIAGARTVKVAVILTVLSIPG